MSFTRCLHPFERTSARRHTTIRIPTNEVFFTLRKLFVQSEWRNLYCFWAIYLLPPIQNWGFSVDGRIKGWIKFTSLHAIFDVLCSRFVLRDHQAGSIPKLGCCGLVRICTICMLPSLTLLIPNRNDACSIGAIHWRAVMERASEKWRQ